MRCARALPINHLMPAASSRKSPVATRCLGGRPGKNERPHPSPARKQGTPSIIVSPVRRPWTQTRLAPGPHRAPTAPNLGNDEDQRQKSNGLPTFTGVPTTDKPGRRRGPTTEKTTDSQPLRGSPTQIRGLCRRSVRDERLPPAHRDAVGAICGVLDPLSTGGWGYPLPPRHHASTGQRLLSPENGRPASRRPQRVRSSSGIRHH